MNLRRSVPLVVVAVALGLLLGACGTTPPAEETSAPAEDTSTPVAEPWAECSGIVERLNAHEEDPTVYEQLEAADFAAPEVGAGVLAGACVIRVTVNDDPITWAIVPGDAAVADAVIDSLTAAGFVGASGFYGDESTNRGVLVKAFASGAELDAFLVYSKAFAPITEPILYLGTFVLS